MQGVSVKVILLQGSFSRFLNRTKWRNASHIKNESK